MTSPHSSQLNLTDKFDTPGQYTLMLQGIVGHLEAILTVPENVNQKYIALLGHPHSLQGGTMNNKVVTTLERAFKELKIASLRFNFRGVGQSEGVYDGGIGESEDLLLLAKNCIQEMPGIHFLYAGFSFGSYVTYRAAAQSPHDMLITIAPSVEHYNYSEFIPSPSPWVVVQGDADEVVPAQSVFDFVAQSNSPISLLRFAETGHFFHGKLIELKERIIEEIRAKIGCHEFK